MLLDILNELSLKSNIPNLNFLEEILKEGIKAVNSVNNRLRPLDDSGKPGGLLNLTGKNTIIIPDLHARRDFLLEIYKKFHKAKFLNLTKLIL